MLWRPSESLGFQRVGCKCVEGLGPRFRNQGYGCEMKGDINALESFDETLVILDISDYDGTISLVYGKVVLGSYKQSKSDVQAR